MSVVLSLVLLVSAVGTSVSASTDVGQIATRSFGGATTSTEGKLQVGYHKESDIKYVQNKSVEFERPVKSKEIVVLVDSSSEVSSKIKKKTSFDYALFSGDPDKNMDLQGGGLTINGDIHSESGIKVGATDFTMNGSCEAVKNVVIESGSAKIDKNKIDEGVDSVNMEDYSIFFDEKSKDTGTCFSFEVDDVTGNPYCEVPLVDPMGTKAGYKNWNIKISSIRQSYFIWQFLYWT